MKPWTRVDTAIVTAIGCTGAAGVLAIPVMASFLPLLGWSGGVACLVGYAKLMESERRQDKPRRRSKRKR